MYIDEVEKTIESICQAIRHDQSSPEEEMALAELVKARAACGELNLAPIPTFVLVNELSQRKGVTAQMVEPDEDTEIKINKSAVVLIVTD